MIIYNKGHRLNTVAFIFYNKKMGIINKENALYMATGIDNSGLYSGLKQSEDRIDQFEDFVKQSGQRIGLSLGAIFGVEKAKSFVNEIVNVRAEMQLLETSFGVLLGNEAASNKMLAEIKQYAIESPLSLNGVAKAAQLLLGFNVEAEKVMPIIRQLGDISMGSTERFQSLALAFAQMSAAGKLMGQDLLQMINAGFNPLQVMSKQTGKSLMELRKDMESGTISSQMVADAFAAATAEGGKFYGMTQKQAEGIKGLQAKLQGGIIDAYNKIGESQNGIITGGYKMMIGLVENYEMVGKSIAALIATYGTYRAAVAFNIAAESGWTIAQMAQYKWLLLVENAQKLLNATMLKNPYVLMATVTIGLVSAMWALHDSTTAQEQAQKRLNEQAEKQAKNADDERSSVEKLMDVIKDDVSTRNEKQKALDALQMKYPSIFKSLDIEKIKNLELADAIRQVNEQIEIRNGKQNQDKQNQAKVILDLFKTDPSSARNQASSFLGKSWYNFSSNQNLIDELNEYLKQSEQKKINDAVTANRAAFNSSPKNIQVNYLKSEIDQLQAQYDRLKKLDADQKNNQFGGGFSVYESQMEILEKQIKAKSSQIQAIQKEETKKTYSAEYKAAKSEWEQAKRDMSAIDKDKEKYSIEEYKAAQDRVKKAKEKYDDLGGDTKDHTKAAQTAAEKAAQRANALKEANEKVLSLTEKNAKEQKRKDEDLQNEIAQSSIDLLEEGTAKNLAQRELDSKKEIQVLERSKEDYIAAYRQAQKEIFDAQEDSNEKAAKKSGKVYTKKSFNGSFVKVDTSAFDSIIDNTKTKQIASDSDYTKQYEQSQQKAWNEYLIKFGNYQQKRKAIADKYNQEIADANEKNDFVGAATLAKERDNTIDELDKSVKESASLMGQLFSDASQKSVSEIQKIIEKAELLMQYLAAVKDAQGNTTIGGKTVSKQDIINIGISDNTLQNLQLSTQEVEALRNALDKLKKDLQGKSPFKLFETQTKEASTKIKSGDLASGIEGIGSATSQFAPEVSQFGKDLGNIVGNDDLGSKIEGVANAIGGVGQAAMGVGQIMNGDIVGGIMNVVSGAPKVVDALDGLFGADYSQYNNLKEQYDGLIDIWGQLIDKKKEYISIDYGDEARKAGQEALDLLNKQLETTKKLAGTRLGSGASMGSHSIGYRMWEGSYKSVDGQNWQDVAGQISSQMGVQFKGMSDMLNMTSEQLLYIKENYSELWMAMDGDFKSYLEDIIAYGDEVKKINDSIKESFTGITFDSFYDNFVATLADMDSDSADFAENFGKYLQKSILANIVAEKYKARIQALYDQWASYSDTNGDGVYDMTAAESQALKDAQAALAAEMLAERDNLASAFGWTSSSSSQSSTYGSSTSMDQDTGDLIVGRSTAILESSIRVEGQNEQIIAIMRMVNADTSALKAQGLDVAENVLMMRQDVNDISSNMSKLVVNTSYLQEMRDILDKIRKNTE